MCRGLKMCVDLWVYSFIPAIPSRIAQAASSWVTTHRKARYCSRARHLRHYINFYKSLIYMERLLHLTSFLSILILLCCTSCKQVEYIPQVSVQHDSIYIAQHSVDTIMQRDSIYVAKVGDTIYQERWHTKYVVREKIDTLHIAQHDTLRIPYPVERVVTKSSIPKWAVLLSCMGAASLLYIILILYRRIKL